jgi:hypothetical protein
MFLKAPEPLRALSLEGDDIFAARRLLLDVSRLEHATPQPRGKFGLQAKRSPLSEQTEA